MDMPILKITVKEVKNVIQNDLNTKKAPGFDLINGTLLKELPHKELRFLTIIYSTMLRLCYFPALWKVAQIILISKPGKNPEERSSYRPCYYQLITHPV